MNPAMIHADGTDCRHAGQPQATVNDDGAPLCPAGIQVTHVRFNGKIMTFDEACVAFRALTDAITAAFAPYIAAITEWGRTVASSLAPAVRVLAATVERTDGPPPSS